MSSNGSNGKVAGGVVIGGVVVAILGVYAWVWGLNFLHFFTTHWRESTPFWFWFVIGLVGLIGVMASEKKRIIFGSIIAASVIFGILFTVPANYNRLNAYYNASVTYEDGMASSYEERSPFEVAQRTSAGNLMNHTGNIQETKALPSEGDHGNWNSLLTTRGPFQGYEAVQNSDYPLFNTPNPQTDIKFCEFDRNNTLRNDGSMPHNNLSRSIYGMVPLNVDYNAGDIYSYCNAEGEPVVVVPLSQIDGFFYPTWSYYGIATYNGKTGALDVMTDKDEINEVPGPVYPMSLAAIQRESITAGGDFWSYFFGTFGYVSATDNAEVNLRSVDDGSYYVTSMSPRGSSSSVVAVAEVSSDTVSGDKYNPLVLNIFPNAKERSANSTLRDQIFSDYAYMPDFNNSEVEVFEITAGKDGSWVASIGRSQSVMYRAYISSSNEITLVNKNGTVIAKGNVAPETGNGEPGEVTVTPVPGSDLSGLSTDELKQLGNAVMDELAKRSN